MYESTKIIQEEMSLNINLKIKYYEVVKIMQIKRLTNHMKCLPINEGNMATSEGKTLVFIFRTLEDIS